MQGAAPTGSMPPGTTVAWNVTGKDPVCFGALMAFKEAPVAVNIFWLTLSVMKEGWRTNIRLRTALCTMQVEPAVGVASSGKSTVCSFFLWENCRCSC